MQFPPHLDPRMFAQMHQQQQQEESSKQQKFIVLILAGGEGKRMGGNLPKVLIPFHGKPMILRILETVDQVSPYKIIVITGKSHDLIQRVIQQKFKGNTSIQCVQQKEALGTGDAVKTALPHLDSDSHVLILNGDMPCIQVEMIAQMVNDSDDIGLVTTSLQEPYGYGRILRDLKKKHFIGIREEKDCTEEERKIKEINVGIYYFHATVLKSYIPKIKNQNQQNEFYLTDIFEIIRQHEDNEIHIHQVPQEIQYQCFGINTPDELKRLEQISPK